MNPIAHIYTDFNEKFGVPRQSGIINELTAKVVFLPEYRQVEAFRGLSEFSHIWLLWDFHQAKKENWSATVKPPMLGGNTRMGVFATRSPFRPNSIGLSSVRLLEVEFTDDLGPVLHVAGADMVNGTPIYDVKPYLPYTDSHPEAVAGFTEGLETVKHAVEFPPELLELIPAEKREGLLALLANDPRPRYQEDPTRRYGVAFAGFDVRFFVEGDVVKVCEVVEV